MSLSLEQLVPLWLDEAQVSEASKKTYLYALRGFNNWAESNCLEFYELRSVHLIKWKEQFSKNHSSLTISNNTIILKNFFKWIEQSGYGKNIANALKVPPKYKGFKKWPLNINQVKQLYNCIDTKTLKGKRDLVLLNLLVRNGIRLIEANRIDIGDIVSIQGEHLINVQRKGSLEKNSIIVLTEKTLESINDYLLTRPPLTDNQPLLISYSKNNFSGRLNTRSMSKIIKSYFLQIGLVDKHFTAHSLRHTAGVNAIKNKAGEYATQLYLGHTNFSTTQFYTRMIENQLMLTQNPSLLTDNLF